MAEKQGHCGYKILCWNRGSDSTVSITKRAWDYYLSNTTESDPDLVFLQEEVSQCNSLFKNKEEEYREFFSEESTHRFNVVVINKSVFNASLKFDISTFVMSFVCNKHVFDVLKEPGNLNGRDVQERIERKGPGNDAYQLTKILKKLFYHFKDNEAMINEAFDDLYRNWKDFKYQEKNKKLHTFEKFRAFLSENNQNLPYADEVLMKVCDRLCAVPLLLSQPLEDGTNIKIIAVSIHMESQSSHLEKVNSVKSLFNFLDALGVSTGCDAIIVGGDFNIDIFDTAEISEETRQGFLIPTYDPTIHRAMHGQSYMCIDYFTYKNYCKAFGPMIEISNVKAKMITSVPGLINETRGQYTINVHEYENDFQKVRSASNHDPIEAILQIYLGHHIAAPIISSTETPSRSTSRSRRKGNYWQEDDTDLVQKVASWHP